MSTDGFNPRAFVIAAVPDTTTLRQLVEDLHRCGIEAWGGSLARDGILDPLMLRRLQSASAVVVLFDAAAAQSQEVARHLVVARQEGKGLIPVRLDGINPELLDAGLVSPSVTWIEGGRPQTTSEIVARIFQEEARQGAAQSPSAPTSAVGLRGGDWRLPLGLVALLSVAALATYLFAARSSGDDRPQQANASAPETSTAAPEPAAPPRVSSGRQQPALSPSMQPVTTRVPILGSTVPAGPAVPPLSAPSLNETVPDDGATAEEANLAVARGFYGALGRGDGTTASALVIPAKRGAGPLSASALTSYYSSFERRLQIRDVRAAGNGSVTVRYDFVLRGGQLCRGQARLDMIQAEDGPLISRITTGGRC